MNKVLAVCTFVLILGQFCLAQKFILPNVVSPNSVKEEWPAQRERIYDKILKTWGTCPVDFGPAKSEFREVKRYKDDGLTYIYYEFHVVDDDWDLGILVLPENYNKKIKYPVVMPVHGTWEKGADGVIDPEGKPHRAYGYELAKRGFVTFCPDQYGFGKVFKSQDSLYTAFEEKYPDWTIAGRQILGLIRAIDFIYQLPFADTEKGIGVIGNSLGGRNGLFIAAFDSRVAVTTVSAGISPGISNTYRGLNKGRRNQPIYWDEVKNNGNYIWDTHEMIALCAPRALMIVEPSNDPYNPYFELSIQAAASALPVWRLYDSTEKFNYLLHGDGHDTTDPVREFEYEWLERFLIND